MDYEALKQKAHSLPFSPGVYIMKDRTGHVIYVGKAKKLRNRVSQYFQDSVNHGAKTKAMVSKIHDFDVIIAASEFEALVLECSLIKRHMPKYNILLKDDKGYPYVRLDTNREYPELSISTRVLEDHAEYYGPFGSRGVTQGLIETLVKTLKLPSCKKVFPRDIGRDRPCLNYHMGICEGWCQPHCTRESYLEIINQVRQLLSGNYKDAAAQMKKQMLDAADIMDFELAATLRDRLRAIESLGQKQMVIAGSMADTDVIGFAQSETKSCFVVLHFCGGNLLDKDYEILPLQDDACAAISSLMKQYYLSCGYAPKAILIPVEVEDSDVFEQLLQQQYSKRVHVKVPKRGDNVRLVELAQKNALEEVQRVTSKEERSLAAWSMLESALLLPNLSRIEAFDISNISGTDIVASMVVFQDGKPLKRDYKRFKIRHMEDQNDFASMAQVIERRFTHYLNSDEGFHALPDLVLIDGGATHANIASEVLARLGIQTVVMGMVKDDRHRTRSLVTPTGKEIAIDAQPALFALIGTIQEETHRFAITFHRNLRSKRLRYSELDRIAGIGPARKQALLKYFKSISAIREATVDELCRVLPHNAASAVYAYFHQQEE